MEITRNEKSLCRGNGIEWLKLKSHYDENGMNGIKN